MGRPTGRPRPVCRPEGWQRRPAHRPAQTGARPGVGLRAPASRPAQAGSTAGDHPDGSGLLAGPGREHGRAHGRRRRRPTHGDRRRSTAREGEGARKTVRKDAVLTLSSEAWTGTATVARIPARTRAAGGGRLGKSRTRSSGPDLPARFRRWRGSRGRSGPRCGPRSKQGGSR